MMVARSHVEEPFLAIMSRHRIGLPIVVFVMSAIAGCGGRAQYARYYSPVPAPRTIVFSVDGAGGFGTTSAVLQETVRACCLPIGVEAFEWSHGTGEAFADQTDFANICHQGRRLAEHITAVRCAQPSVQIHVVAHSAGSAVALTALGQLPPDSVGRLVLLAPSVSADYDLRGPLRACRCGIDVFYSERDVGYLWAAVGVVGLADRRWTDAAGRTGFVQCSHSPEDNALYARLRQHEWTPCVAWTGNDGGHYGNHKREFMRAYVVPLISPKPLAAHCP
jgi:pimeloyl-ACP methyl ester carboxylesterase